MNSDIHVALPMVVLVTTGGIPVLIPAVSLPLLGDGDEITLVVRRPPQPPSQREDDDPSRWAAWLRIKEASRLHVDDVDGLNEAHAKTRVIRAADSGKFTTNGKHGRERRIDPISFAAWWLRERERNLNSSEGGT